MFGFIVMGVSVGVRGTRANRDRDDCLVGHTTTSSFGGLDQALQNTREQGADDRASDGRHRCPVGVRVRA